MVHLRHLDMQDTSMAGHPIVHFIAACNDLRTYIGSQCQTELELVVSSLLKHSDSFIVLDLGNSFIVWTEGGWMASRIALLMSESGAIHGYGFKMHTVVVDFAKSCSFSIGVALSNGTRRFLGMQECEGAAFTIRVSIGRQL
ncbi:MAG: hypothetical protein BYD32DRAFT_462582 [Podila humilis]|nr:MAG: hypothetical protein BYD32DRAFT_462582 [Podila humilis]